MFFGFFLLLALPATAQIATPIRNKISAGDILSAESILEVHEREKGRDAHYLEGLAWVARGAVLLNDWKRAAAHDQLLRSLLEEKLRATPDLSKDPALAAALGAQIEIHAQIAARQSGAKSAIRFLDQELTRPQLTTALRSRIYKRRNQIRFTGTAAPAISAEETLGAGFTSLEAYKGSPVLIFGWAQWCGDCRAQVAALGRIRQRFASRGLKILLVTRFYETDRAKEREAIAKTWKEHYKPLDGLPSVISTPAMERYGVSATPTFTLLSRNGKVAHYLPYRLTEAEFARLIEPLL